VPAFAYHFVYFIINGVRLYGARVRALGGEILVFCHPTDNRCAVWHVFMLTDAAHALTFGDEVGDTFCEFF